jgi:hypothetical protein
MPRISQVAMVLGTVGLCIAINNWRYPIVRQMVAQLPSWEFSIQPRRVDGIASASAPMHPPPGENAQKMPQGSPISPTLNPLYVGMSVPPLQHTAPSPSGSPEVPSGGKTSSLQTQCGEVTAGKSVSVAPSCMEENHGSGPEGPPSPRKESSSGIPGGLAEMSQTDTQNAKPPGCDGFPILPLVPLDISGNGDGAEEQKGAGSPSSEGRVVCTGTSCKLRAPCPEQAQRPETRCVHTTAPVSPGRARIVQVRAIPLEGENGSNPTGEALSPNNLLSPRPEKNKTHSNPDYFPSKEDTIELLPPVDPPLGGGSPGFRLPWPSGTIPFYPSTQSK